MRRGAQAVGKTFDFRCPVHGFVTVEDEWERDIIQHPVFQRLRRIRQLAWTDMVYPGAVHTRFEHSLGVMHTATRMFDEVWARNERALEALNFSKESRARDRKLLRLASLLHDVGHSPFSHAGEEVMPFVTEEKRYKHEQYSAELVRQLMTDVIDNHRLNQRGWKIPASEIADFIEGKATIGLVSLFWRQLMSSQLDADRADYLLRDSHHTGVKYGQFDLDRLFITLTVAEDPETGAPLLAVARSGWHNAEALILARYMMFNQVYFHKTRSIYDFHIGEVLQTLLAEAQKDSGRANASAFPPPDTKEHLQSYFEWDDWRVLGLLHQGAGGEHGQILRDRRHYREVFSTPDVATEADLKLAETVAEKLGAFAIHTDDASTSWYKPKGEILVADGDVENPKKIVRPLSEISDIVRNMRPINRVRLYVPLEKRDGALAIVKKTLEAAAKKKLQKRRKGEASKAEAVKSEPFKAEASRREAPEVEVSKGEVTKAEVIPDEPDAAPETGGPA
jgi:HD superfamily phosphohydrolase